MSSEAKPEVKSEPSSNVKSLKSGVDLYDPINAVILLLLKFNESNFLFPLKYYLCAKYKKYIKLFSKLENFKLDLDFDREKNKPKIIIKLKPDKKIELLIEPCEFLDMLNQLCIFKLINSEECYFCTEVVKSITKNNSS